MTKVEYAVQWALNIANDDSHGYDQGNRWGPDYDCSSLIISAYEAAGIPVKSVGGAQRTYDMRQTFKKCGFTEVSNWNKSTGAGLRRGDVVLNVQHHTEMYIGNGQLVKASQNENGGAMGGKPGDQTRKEIRISGYYNYPWDCALRYDSSDAFTSTNSFLINAFDYAQSGTLVDVQPDYKKIDCYLITLNRNSPDVDFNRLKDIGVVGVLIEEGSLYDVTHKENNKYVNPRLDSQVRKAIDSKMPYGFFADVKAQSIAEANRELSWLRIYASKYVPPLGMWLNLHLTKSKSTNDSIIARYKEVLDGAGFHGKMGFYVTRAQLNQITWSKWKDDFLLLLIDHISDISEIETLLTPEFFMLEKK